jgi:hypothetical protein
LPPPNIEPNTKLPTIDYDLDDTDDFDFDLDEPSESSESDAELFEPTEKLNIQNQEISMEEKMVISFYYFPTEDREAYALFFESKGIRVSRQNLNLKNLTVTHVIARGNFDASNNINFAAFVSGIMILHASYIQACMNADKILTNFSDFEFWKFMDCLPVKISEDLETIVGPKEATEHFVAKQMRAYIKENKLLDPKDKQFIICDEKLEKIIGQKKTKCFDMIKYLRPHMTKIPEFSM